MDFGFAIFLPAISNAVPCAGDVRKIPRPIVTFTALSFPINSKNNLIKYNQICPNTIFKKNCLI